MSVASNYYTRVIDEVDYSEWYQLFVGYRDFYKVAFNEDEIRTTWQWLMSENENIHGLVCVEKTPDDSERIVGFMHYFEEISSLSAVKGGFLNDLYVSPERRGQGVFESLFDALKAIGIDKNWQRIQWRTAEDNYRARSAYDRIADKVEFLTYRLVVNS